MSSITKATHQTLSLTMSPPIHPPMPTMPRAHTYVDIGSPLVAGPKVTTNNINWLTHISIPIEEFIKSMNTSHGKSIGLC